MSIGAFYFGDVSKIVTTIPIDLTLEMNTPIVIPGYSTTINTYPVNLFLNINNNVQVYAFKDYTVDFVGIPRAGYTPLTVDFSANVKFLANTPYTIQDYNWYFDYIENPTVYTTCAGTSATHVYEGYAGKKYSVKLIVNLNS